MKGRVKARTKNDDSTERKKDKNMKIVQMMICNWGMHPSPSTHYILRTLTIPHKHKTQDKKGGKEKEME